jgi:hypothetical protein
MIFLCFLLCISISSFTLPINSPLVRIKYRLKKITLKNYLNNFYDSPRMLIIILVIEQFMHDKGVEELGVFLLAGSGVYLINIMRDQGIMTWAIEQKHIFDYS